MKIAHASDLSGGKTKLIMSTSLAKILDAGAMLVGLAVTKQ